MGNCSGFTNLPFLNHLVVDAPEDFSVFHYLLPRLVSKVSQPALGVFTLVTRGWAASEFLTRVTKFNMMPNGECQIIGPD